jgi:TolA-binding protein
MQKRPSISALLTLILFAHLSEPAKADQLHRITLPDDGPRYEGSLKGADGDLFTRGMTALGQERYPDAEQAFNTLLTNFPSSPLTDASLAFLAEIFAKGGTDQQRRLAIDAYRTLIREGPSSVNASRARWRIGDLYAQGRWLIEAKASYEQALAESPGDAARALFGLGLVFLEEAQWKDAEHAFQQVRTRTEDDRLLSLATVGLAEALVRAKQWDKAQSAYESGIQRWPTVFKAHPESMLLFADVEMNFRKHAEARAIWEQFYNLYPAHTEAPSTLIRIGDSWRQAGRTDRGKTLYAAVIQKHAGTYQESVARMRLVEVARERLLREPKPGPQLGIDTVLDGRPALDAEVREQEEMLEQIAEAYASVELGSEALFHLGEHLESLDRRLEAVQVYRRLSDRKGLVADDPWPEAAGRRLVDILGPWIQAALRAHDDLTAVNLFYRHGAFADSLYAGHDLLLQLADAHHRLGFSPQAIKLYQTLVRDTAPESVREKEFFVLVRAYRDQHDLPAARRVFERTLLQYPTGRSKPIELQHLAETLQRQGDWNGVIRMCRLWLRHADAPSPRERQHMLYLLASAQAETGQVRQALDTLARVIPSGSSKANGTCLRYADHLLLAGQFEQAAARYTQVIRTSPSPAMSNGHVFNWQR